MSLPDFEPRHTDRNGKPYEGVKFALDAVDKDGNDYSCQLSFLNFSDEYQALLLVLGAGKNDKGNLSGKTIDPVGLKFRGEIWMRPDNNDKDKFWTDIRKVQMVTEDWPKAEEQQSLPEKQEEEDDDIPF